MQSSCRTELSNFMDTVIDILHPDSGSTREAGLLRCIISTASQLSRSEDDE